MLSKKINQIGRFSVVGVLNTLLDIGILNLLIFITGVFSGFYYSIFKMISFLIANINSFFCNKLWVFKNYDNFSRKCYFKFLLISLVGVLLNVVTASFIVNYVSVSFSISDIVWANIGGIVAVIVSMIWNFIGYRNFIFNN